MDIYEPLTEYAGLPVVTHGAGGERPAAGEAAWRVATSYDGPDFDERFAAFVEEVDTAAVTALVIGFWDMEPLPVKVLTDAAAAFPNLRALFVGDIDIEEEAHLSWIQHTDITPVLHAFPGLERFEVRGAEDLSLSPFRSDALRVLRFESAGLPADVVRAVGASGLPNLEHLDLWLGVEHRGGDATAEDLAPLLDGARFPSLRHFGLFNTPMLDELAGAVASAPAVARLESLALALGTLTDRGAEALLTGQPLTHLRRLDLSGSYLSEKAAGRLKAALPGVALDLETASEFPWGDDDGDRQYYVAVSE
ncbi:STM4015 family protein [Actinomadura rifamycini]|uniref:STM4015 family protein n=1 Tax=Actinomadura rifamycini TaxID=31962 RepID=UPI000412F8AA|nr:STM4015 family protein [Actinomadura rifamycini]